MKSHKKFTDFYKNLLGAQLGAQTKSLSKDTRKRECIYNGKVFFMPLRWLFYLVFLHDQAKRWINKYENDGHHQQPNLGCQNSGNGQ